MITDIDNFNADVFCEKLHPLYERALPEYVKMVKRSVYDYKKLRLYVWEDENKQVVRYIRVFHGKYHIGSVMVEYTNTAQKLRVRANYGQHVLGEVPASLNANIIAKNMVKLFNPPRIEDEVVELHQIINERARECVQFWSGQANEAQTKANNLCSEEMFFHEYQSPIVNRVMELIAMDDVDTAKVREQFREWIAESVPEKLARYRKAMDMWERHKKSYAGGQVLLADCAYVREWSDGSGVLITGNERHYLDSVMDGLPAEIAEKVSILKVSGLDMLDGVGINGGTHKLHDSLKSSVYFLIRD